MKVVTSGQMADIDRTTIKNGTPGITLMRNAGSTVYELIDELFPEHGRLHVVVVCGKGNNGGDGFRVAELLQKSGHETTAYLAGIVDDVDGDARTCLEDARAVGVVVHELSDSELLGDFEAALRDADVVVDALFGTGLTGDIRGVAAGLVECINQTDAVAIAVDVPSGVDASSGTLSVNTVIADYTVTFGCLKVGHVSGEGRTYCGEVIVREIGFDNSVIENSPCEGYALTLAEAESLLPFRPYNAHKGTCGRLLVMAGSVGKTGAAAMAALASMRTGAGLVTVGCPESLNDILESMLTEIMTIPLPEVRKKRCFALRGLGEARQFAKNMDVIAIGPGIGVYHETTELVRRFVGTWEGPLILDADGINSFAHHHMDELRDSPADIILTPHYGELSRLTGVSIDTIASAPEKAAREAAEMCGAAVLLKGAPTLIANSDGELWYNPTGNESMATAGMGDILTGMVAGLCAQGLSPFDAGKLGAYIHGRSAELASFDYGIHGLMATDMLEYIPEALVELEY